MKIKKVVRGEIVYRPGYQCSRKYYKFFDVVVNLKGPMWDYTRHDFQWDEEDT